MAFEPITPCGGTMPSFDNPRSAPDAKRTRVERPAARAKAQPLVDRIEVSTTARKLANAVTDPQPQLQLSQQQLNKMSTGR